MKTFNPAASHPERAVQAWQILVGMAMNRQTTTYERLSVMMYGKAAAGVLAQILGHIAHFCDQCDIPALNAIVVGKLRGTPGEEIPPVGHTMDRERERIYDFDWYNICPPTSAELAAAYAQGRRKDKS